MGKPDAPFVDFTSLEKTYLSTADAFIASFGGEQNFAHTIKMLTERCASLLYGGISLLGRKPRRPFGGDVEANFMLDNGPPSIGAPWVETGRRRRKPETPFRRGTLRSDSLLRMYEISKADVIFSEAPNIHPLVDHR
jgi:hypothetical protein